MDTALAVNKVDVDEEQVIPKAIVNRGKWLGRLAKFFVLCFWSLFWP